LPVKSEDGDGEDSKNDIGDKVDRFEDL